MDELHEAPETLSHDIKGIILVDHPRPLRKWETAKILSIFDHHQDGGAGPDAEPRIFEKTASCTTIVARQVLDELEQLPQEYHMPHELLEMILGAIAIDSDALNPDKSSDADRATAQRILRRSNWRTQDFSDVMERLDSDLGEAKKNIGHLGVRDLLRRDWKGDLVDTPSPRTPTVSLGFASIPYSLDEQIAETEFKALFDWFAIEAAWTAKIGADVRSDVRVDEDQADELFRVVSKAIENEPTLKAKRWHRADELAPRQMVWTHERADAGRKVVRPIIEAAVKVWD